MRTRSIIIPAALLLLTIVLTVPACRSVTEPKSGVSLGLHQSEGGNPDSTGTNPPPPPPSTGLSLGVSADSSAVAGNASFLELFVGNSNGAAVQVNYSFLGPDGWNGVPASGSLTIQAQSSAVADIRFTVPVGTPAGVYVFHYEVDEADGTHVQSGDFSFTVHPS